MLAKAASQSHSHQRILAINMLQAPPTVVPDVGGMNVDCSKDRSGDQGGEAQMEMVGVRVKSPAPPLCSLKDVKKGQCIQQT